MCYNRRMDTYGEFEFQVRSYECGPDGRATLPTICNYLQATASRHAETLKFSKSDFESAGENISWVLTRLRVKMTRFPTWEERVRVGTFPRGGRKLVAWRDFVVRSEGGETLGVAASEWMLINLQTRKLVGIPPSVFAAANDVRAPVLGEEPFLPRLRFPAEGERTQWSSKAQHSHLDLNGHVNNVHSVEWLLEPLQGRSPREMELVFRGETLAGEEVFVETVEQSGEGTTFHRLFSPDGRDKVLAVSRG